MLIQFDLIRVGVKATYDELCLSRYIIPVSMFFSILVIAIMTLPYNLMYLVGTTKYNIV